jgi:cobalt transporter subunit CbtA
LLRNLILAAAAAGLAAGLVTAALQHVTTTPIILAAEAYEVNAPAALRHAADDGQATAPHSHDHAAEGWTPADGAERTLYTSLATLVTGIGFALALVGAMALSNRRIDGWMGLAFGAAGFTAVALAPALGLPPEMPGNAAADLHDRQLWWAFTVVVTAGGLAALLLTPNKAVRVGGVALLALPHIIGAPQPAEFASTAPAELAAHFAAASLVVSAVFWAVLGAAAGTVHARLTGPG